MLLTLVDLMIRRSGIACEARAGTGWKPVLPWASKLY